MIHNKIIVTGATGFIGSNTIPLLKKLNYETYGISRNGWIPCDILNDNDIRKTMERIKPTHLLHLAWDVSDGYMTSINNFDWLLRSQILIKSFAECGGKRVVIAGTGCGNQEAYYCACKHLLNESIKTYAAQAGLSYAYGKIFYLYGESERGNRLIPGMINSLLDNKPFTLRQNNVGDYLYVKDVASALVTILNSDIEGDVDIGSGIAITSKAVLNEIYELIGTPYIDSEVPKGVTYLADTTRIEYELKWCPRYTLKQGLKETIDWWKELRTTKEEPG